MKLLRGTQICNVYSQKYIEVYLTTTEEALRDALLIFKIVLDIGLW